MIKLGANNLNNYDQGQRKRRPLANQQAIPNMDQKESIVNQSALSAFGLPTASQSASNDLSNSNTASVGR